MASNPKHGARWPGTPQSLIRRAAELWAESRTAISPEGRDEFERLARLYERKAVRVARRDLHKSTLGDLLFGIGAEDRTSEAQWIDLVRRIGERDQAALQTLYAWSHLLVLTLIVRITNDWRATHEAALEVFHGVWLEASQFNPVDDTVIGWLMNKTRSSALRAGLDKNESSATTQAAEPPGDWPSDVQSFSAACWERIAARIVDESNDARLLRMTAAEHEAAWERPAPDIECKILASDSHRDRISMLVRLAPWGTYPAHMHAGPEQLHLLQGELWIDDRKLHPGDYHSSGPGTIDERVWSITGCTCILITSSRDILS